MSLSPTNIFQRLPELKSWQSNHEELLKRLKNLSGSNVTSASDYQSIEGLSAFDSTTINESSTKDAESQIISPAKPFSQLLEEKLAEEPDPPGNKPDKPKRPFLRKGAGLQRFRMSLEKPKSAKKAPPKIKFNAKAKNFDNEITPLRVPDLIVKPKAKWSKPSDNAINKINELAQANESLTSEPSEQTLYERALEKELRIFEALEEKAENSSFSSTNSSVMRILASTPSKRHKTIEKQAPIAEEKRVHWESSDHSDVIESNLEKRDIKEILMNLQRLTEENKNIRTGVAESPIEFSDDEKWSTTEESCETSSVSSSDLEETLRTDKKDMATETNEDHTCHECVDLKQKIAELEDKIKNLNKDRERLFQIKKDLEHKKDILERDHRRKKSELEEEIKLLQFELESEKKKLAREKQIFQSYMKDSQNRPSKKEREEISNLKQEIADLRETLKMKESKNGMTQARLRNQVKQLEKDNSSLKDEVEKLTKENAKLNASKKINRRPSETKILHEINKNITKLTEDALKKQKIIQSETDNGNKSREETKRSSNDVDLSPKTPNFRKKSSEKENQSSDDFDSLLEVTNFRKTDYVNVEKEYESVFRKECTQNQTIDESKKNVDRVEKILEDASKEIKYSNGNIKTISPDGNYITMKYYNGDVKQTFLLEGLVKYFYFDKKIWQTSYPDGSDFIEFPDGSKEKRLKDGTLEITLPDGIFQKISPNGCQEVRYSDGSVLKIESNGDKILHLPNGQKEIETKEHKRREYPDGNVKILYPDGSQETRYANGRVRIKDKNGVLIVDTHS